MRHFPSFTCVLYILLLLWNLCSMVYRRRLIPKHFTCVLYVLLLLWNLCSMTYRRRLIPKHYTSLATDEGWGIRKQSVCSTKNEIIYCLIVLEYGIYYHRNYYTWWIYCKRQHTLSLAARCNQCSFHSSCLRWVLEFNDDSMCISCDKLYQVSDNYSYNITCSSS